MHNKKKCIIYFFTNFYEVPFTELNSACVVCSSNSFLLEDQISFKETGKCH